MMGRFMTGNPGWKRNVGPIVLAGAFNHGFLCSGTLCDGMFCLVDRMFLKHSCSAIA
jgi:hypothetical protein